MEEVLLQQLLPTFCSWLEDYNQTPLMVMVCVVICTVVYMWCPEQCDKSASQFSRLNSPGKEVVEQAAT